MTKARPSTAYILSSNGGFFIIILSLFSFNFSYSILLAIFLGSLIVLASYFIYITRKHVREIGVFIIVLSLFTLAISPIYLIGFIFCLIGGILAIRWKEVKT
jgi:uncharacterized Tic20 family protein